MNVRSKIYGGSIAADDPLLHVKRPKGAKADNLLSVATPRHERRAANHRLGDRHRLVNETVRLAWNGADHEVELINLSGGGAMVQAAIQPLLWDAVTLYLGPNGTVDCAVCWRRDDRIGLQFADETRLDCPADEVATLLRNAILHSFPESASVEWVVGDQVGLRFHTPFDMSLLAQSRPSVAPGWECPAYLENGGGEAEWDRRWRKLDLDQLRTELEGFMKR